MSNGPSKLGTRHCFADGPCGTFAPFGASPRWSDGGRPQNREDVRNRSSVGAGDRQPVVTRGQWRYLGEGPVLADLVYANAGRNRAGPKVKDRPAYSRAGHVAANLVGDGRLLVVEVADTQPEPAEASEELTGIGGRAAQQSMHMGEHRVRILQRGMPAGRIHHVTLRFEQLFRYRRQTGDRPIASLICGRASRQHARRVAVHDRGLARSLELPDDRPDIVASGALVIIRPVAGDRFLDLLMKPEGISEQPGVHSVQWAGLTEPAQRPITTINALVDWEQLVHRRESAQGLCKVEQFYRAETLPPPIDKRIYSVERAAVRRAERDEHARIPPALAAFEEVTRQEATHRVPDQDQLRIRGTRGLTPGREPLTALPGQSFGVRTVVAPPVVGKPDEVGSFDEFELPQQGVANLSVAIDAPHTGKKVHVGKQTCLAYPVIEVLFVRIVAVHGELPDISAERGECPAYAAGRNRPDVLSGLLETAAGNTRQDDHYVLHWQSHGLPPLP